MSRRSSALLAALALGGLTVAPALAAPAQAATAITVTKTVVTFDVTAGPVGSERTCTLDANLYTAVDARPRRPRRRRS